MRLVGSGAATPQAVKTAAFLAFGVAAVAGLVLAATTAWWLVAVGAVCVLAAWFYTGGGKPYGYLGLGEVMVFVFFGLVAVIGTTYVQTADLGVARALRRRRHRRPGLRDPRRQQPARHPHRHRRRQAHPRRSARRRAHPLPLRPAGRRGRGSRGRRGRRGHDVVGAARARLPRPDRRRPTRDVLGGATGPALVPVLAATGVSELIWAVLVAAPLLVLG